MGGPWDKYAASGSGPWAKYGGGEAAPPEPSPLTPSLEETRTGLTGHPISTFDAFIYGLRNPSVSWPATSQALSQLGQDVWSAAKGALAPFNPVQQPGENAFTQLPIVRIAKSLAEPVMDLPQVPGAIRDINASPDPLGTYANVAQQTASQGAGQALTALAAEGAMKAPGAVNRYIPSFERGGKGLAALDQAYANYTPRPIKSYQAATELMDKLERTGVTVPGPLRAFVERIQAGGHGDIGPITFPEMREFRTALNDVAWSSDKSTARQLRNVASRVNQDIINDAPHQSFLNDYQRFNRDYARASQWGRNANIGGRALGGSVGAVGGYELGRMTGIPHLPWVLGGAGGAVGTAITKGLVDRVLERPMETPILTRQPKVLPTPPEIIAPKALPAGQYEMPPSTIEGELAKPSFTPRTPEQIQADTLTHLRTQDPNFVPRPLNPFDATEGAMETLRNDPFLRRAEEERFGTPGPPREQIWTPEERTINTAPAGQAIEAKGPKGEVEHTIAPEPAWPSEYDNIPRTGKVTAGVKGGAGANYSAEDLARLKARNKIKEPQ